MQLEPEGKKRLETMKKTLAARLPLAGLLAASAVGVAVQGFAPEALAGSLEALNDNELQALPVHLAPDGHLVVEDGTPVVIVGPEEKGGAAESGSVDRVFPGWLSGGRPGGPSEEATEEP